jgi:hypothetical protein
MSVRGPDGVARTTYRNPSSDHLALLARSKVQAIARDSSGRIQFHTVSNQIEMNLVHSRVKRLPISQFLSKCPSCFLTAIITCAVLVRR